MSAVFCHNGDKTDVPGDARLAANGGVDAFFGDKGCQ